MRSRSCAIGLAATLAASVASADPTMVISEFMAINNTMLTDEDGAYSDWIELYNSGTNALDLGG